MLQAATISLLLALAPAANAGAGKTLWLFQPLYPGQDLLVARGEDSLARLMASTAQGDQIIGAKALATWLSGRRADLSCLVGGAACADPVDAFVGSLGFERVVLLKAGQEDPLYRVRVTSYLPATGEVATAEGTGPSLERALLAATLKVVPLASTVEVVTSPPGATVFVDGEKVGVTPFSGQVLPGERVVKVELGSHMPAERKLQVPVRGTMNLELALEKVPARLVVAAKPKLTAIAIDGKPVGADKLDVAIQPGKHRISFARDGYLPLEEEVDIEPGATVTVDRVLEPTTWTSVRTAMTEAEDDVYGRKSYVQLSFEYATLWGDALRAQDNPFKKTGPLARQLTAPSALTGVSMEYGQDARYFGVMLVGLAYYTSSSPWGFTLEESGDDRAGSGSATLFVVRAMQPHLRFALWRLLFTAQAGVEARGLLLSPSEPAGAPPMHFVDVEVTGQLGVRAHVVAGAFVEGVFRHGWTFTDRAALQGFHVGVGYAY